MFWETLALPKCFRIKEASAGMKRDEKRGGERTTAIGWMLGSGPLVARRILNETKPKLSGTEI